MSFRRVARRFIRSAMRGLFLSGTLALGLPIPTPAQTPAATKADKGTEVGTPVAASAEDRARCESYIPVLTGKKKGSAMLADPRLKALANISVELVTCGAIAANSDDLCKLLSPHDASECRRKRGIVHELKANPKGRGFFMSEDEYQSCRKELPKQNVPAEFCDKYRDALRSGDPSKCPSGPVEGMEGWCRGLVTMDKSQCTGVGKVEDREQGKAACEKLIDQNKQFATGLNELAKSGSPFEQAIAKAALGQPNACQAFVTPALKACAGDTEAGAPPKDQAPPAATPGASPAARS